MLVLVNYYPAEYADTRQPWSSALGLVGLCQYRVIMTSSRAQTAILNSDPGFEAPPRTQEHRQPSWIWILGQRCLLSPDSRKRRKVCAARFAAMDPASEAFRSCPLESSFRYTSTILKDAAEAPGRYASLLPGAWSKAGSRCRAPSSARASKTLACQNRERCLHPKTLACQTANYCTHP